MTLPKEFADLDYPGRRKPKNRPGSKGQEPVSDSEVWDHRPVYYLVKGEKIEFFVISHLSKALGYSAKSIRLWETKGLLPQSPYRAPKSKAPMAAGRSSKGRRLWTREQIEGILRLARRHNVILNRKPPTAAFARDVKVLFDRIVNQ